MSWNHFLLNNSGRPVCSFLKCCHSNVGLVPLCLFVLLIVSSAGVSPIRANATADKKGLLMNCGNETTVDQVIKVSTAT